MHYPVEENKKNTFNKISGDEKKKRKMNPKRSNRLVLAANFYICPVVLWNLFRGRFLYFLKSSTEGLVCKYLMVSKVGERPLTAKWAARESPGV